MEELISGLKNRENDAFKKVMALYKSQIYNYLRLLVGNPEIAEELTQDTFVKVYFKANSLRTDNLKSWIYKIATNLARSEFRKNKLKNIFSLQDVNEGQIGFETNYENEIFIEQMLSTLPEKYKIPLVMKEIDNFSFEEISSVLDKPVGTVKTLVFRGKSQLKNNYSRFSGGNNG